ncbi:MAG: hypothetical protein M3040_05125 [Bacteroidota bacterium]|nr:hypothetical protein [Bacteroidota bacterium]
MSHPTHQRLTRRTKKAVFGRLKLSTELSDHATNNETIHDIFTIVLIMTAIVLMIVL